MGDINTLPFGDFTPLMNFNSAMSVQSCDKDGNKILKDINLFTHQKYIVSAACNLEHAKVIVTHKDDYKKQDEKEITHSISNNSEIVKSKLLQTYMEYIKKGANAYDSKIVEKQVVGKFKPLFDYVDYICMQGNFVRIATGFGTGKSYIILEIISTNRPEWRMPLFNLFVRYNPEENFNHCNSTRSQKINLPPISEINNIYHKYRNNNDNVEFSDYIPMTMNSAGKSAVDYKKLFSEQSVKFNGMVKRIFPPHKRIRTNLIFVGKSVTNQWKDYVANTKLNVFFVENVYAVRDFVDMFDRCITQKPINFAEIEKYDAIIIKNDKISAKVDYKSIPIELLNLVKNSHIMTVFVNILRGYMVERTFYDDFDTIGIPSNAGYIVSKCNYIVSASQNETSKNKRTDIFPSMASFINYSADPLLNDITFNTINFHSFSLNVDPEVIGKSIQLPNPEFRKYVVKNPNAKLVNAMAELADVEDANGVIDLINSDCTEQACAKVGIKTGSVIDIFEKVLGDKFEVYKNALNFMNFTKQLFEYINHPDNANVLHIYSPEMEYFGKNKINHLFRQHKSMPNVKLIKFFEMNILYKYDIKKVVEEIIEEQTKIRENAGKAIDRVKDNIKQQTDCPICYADLTDDDTAVVIFKCCGIIPCISCAFKGSNLAKYNKKIQMSCPNCKKTIGITDLIAVDKTLNMDDIINTQELEDKAEEIVECIVDESTEVPIDYSEWSKQDLVLSFALQTNPNYLKEWKPPATPIDTSKNTNFALSKKNKMNETRKFRHDNRDEVKRDEIAGAKRKQHNEIPKNERIVDDPEDEEIDNKLKNVHIGKLTDHEMLKSGIEKEDVIFDDLINSESYIKQLRDILSQKRYVDGVLLKDPRGYQVLPKGTPFKQSITGLMKGTDIQGNRPESGHSKVIFFASHDETLSNAEKKLDEYGIPYLRIGGTTGQIAAQVKMLNEGLVNILTINNSKFSSGLNLIAASVIVMLHDIKNDAEKSQLCGRIVRCGQKFIPEIVTILYDTE